MTMRGAAGQGDGSGKILIVDDEGSVRLALERLLAFEGFAVSTAADGIAALRAVESEEFDVILLDLVMPGMDGLQVFEALLEAGNPAEVIFLTGHGTISTAVSALKNGALDYLQKPWSGDEMAAKVRYAVEVRRHKTKGILQRAFENLAREYKLTYKQCEVCESLLAGRSNAHIATIMKISPSTVKTHLKRIFLKLGVESRTEMIARILENLDSVNNRRSEDL